MPAPQSLEDYQKAQEADWNQYVATETIFIDGVRAFNEGDPVPAGHVKRGVVAKSAVSAKSKDA